VTTFTRELFAIERRRLDVRAGIAGAVIVALLGVAILLVGPEAIAAVIGALVVLVSGAAPAGKSWASALLPLVVGGAVLTFVAVSIGGQPLLAAALVGIAALAGALHAGRSSKAEARALIAMLWIILALSLHDTGVSPLTYAVGFAAGGALGAAAALVRARRAAPEVGVAQEPGPDAVPVREAAIRSVCLALATWAGFAFFPDHPAWIAITALLVLRPAQDRPVSIGVQRALGTGIGVVVAVAIAELVGERQVVLVLLLLASAFFMMAARDMNYALFAVFATTFVVYSQRILGVDAATSGRDRFLETAIGVVIALLALYLIGRINPQRSSGD
jgi:hypothetical protein